MNVAKESRNVRLPFSVDLARPIDMVANDFPQS